MKKLFVLAIVAAGTFLASCGGNSNEATAPAPDTTAATVVDTAAVAVDTAATETADTTAVK